jgi:hypothetical protein
MVCASLAAMSLELNPSYVQDQVSRVLLASALSLLNVLLLTHSQLIQEFRLALWLGRTLALPSEELVSCKQHIEFKADGRIQQLQVSWECQQFSAAGAIAQAHTVNFVAG